MGKETATESDDLPGPVTEEIVDAEVVESSHQADSNTPDTTLVENQVQQRSSAIPLILVGLIALAIGGGAVYLLNPAQQDNQAEIDRLSEQIESLSKAVAVPKSDAETVDAVSRLEGAITDELGGIGSTIGGLSDQLKEFDARMTNLESKPAPGTPAELTDALESLRADLRAWQEEAQRLRVENAELQAQIETTKQALTDAESVNATIKNDLESALEASVLSQNERSAGVIARIEAAVIAGLPFAEFAAAYQETTGNGLPDELAVVADTGVWSTSRLQDEFPARARAALAHSLEQQTDRGLLQRSGDFLRAQLGVRSVVARDGNSPDAILSRAQGAIDRADFSAALAEIKALEADLKSILSDWSEQATLRVESVKSVNKLVGNNE